MWRVLQLSGWLVIMNYIPHHRFDASKSPVSASAGTGTGTGGWRGERHDLGSGGASKLGAGRVCLPLELVIETSTATEDANWRCSSTHDDDGHQRKHNLS